MDVYAAMSTQRAVRRLQTDPTPHDVLERFVQAATWAPSGGNQQPWRVVVVTAERLRFGALAHELPVVTALITNRSKPAVLVAL